jgi:hypothetical protein
MIWDFCPDMMHIIKTFFERLVLGVFSGSRRPAPFKNKRPTKPSRNAPRHVHAEYKEKKRQHKALKTAHAAELQAFDECLFTEADRKIVDRRVRNLTGYAYWIRTSLVHSRTRIQQKISKVNPRIPKHNIKLDNNLRIIALNYTNSHILQES